MRPGTRRDCMPHLWTLTAGSRGVNDPLGRAWGQTARARGGSFTPRFTLEPTLVGRHNAPPFQRASDAFDRRSRGPSRSRTRGSAADALFIWPTPERRTNRADQKTLPRPLFCEFFCINFYFRVDRSGVRGSLRLPAHGATGRRHSPQPSSLSTALSSSTPLVVR